MPRFFLSPWSLYLVCLFAKFGHAAGPPEPGQTFTNVQGTFWNRATFAGSCLLQTYQQPHNLEYVAVAKDLNGRAEYCGACIQVTPLSGKRAPVVAVVSSYCADCPPGALDMPQTMYNRLMGDGPRRPGVGRFNWEVVVCPFAREKPEIINKQGASKFHVSILIADASLPIARVEIQSAGKWFQAQKTAYNCWEIPNQPVLSDRVNLKVTCSNSHTFVLNSLNPANISPIKAPSNC
ncbi:hypothetical protein PCANC_17734 [Puccinia coronata f. sp. avenae]|uniref:Expansin-like EG45 domain-containing protein n=1 Tax=Puccinia coronata f. sp. avenae TaxID=200324 RepID=A0A2N5UBD7_9BASI|nr:hypothetical protein PCANC_17734 [Puccinia coronata f. sp. avenae]PLW35054.1 hypothetical protein PCASD_16165 [Puccinia coronata f. sp. avenae]